MNLLESSSSQKIGSGLNDLKYVLESVWILWERGLSAEEMIEKLQNLFKNFTPVDLLDDEKNLNEERKYYIQKIKEEVNKLSEGFGVRPQKHNATFFIKLAESLQQEYNSLKQHKDAMMKSVEKLRHFESGVCLLEIQQYKLPLSTAFPLTDDARGNELENERSWQLKKINDIRKELKTIFDVFKLFFVTAVFEKDIKSLTNEALGALNGAVIQACLKNTVLEDEINCMLGKLADLYDMLEDPQLESTEFASNEYDTINLDEVTEEYARRLKEYKRKVNDYSGMSEISNTDQQ